MDQFANQKTQMAELIKKKTTIYMLPTGDILWVYGHTWTESEGLKKETPCVW